MDLLNKIHEDLSKRQDYFQVVLMIGTNDCRCDVLTDPGLFAETYSRILSALSVMGYSRIYALDIPPIHLVGGDFPYDRLSVLHRNELNQKIFDILSNHPIEGEGIVAIDHLDEYLLPKHYLDAVHFNKFGNRALAERISFYIGATD